jgi:signal peptidase II
MLIWILLAGAILGIDQISKLFCLNYLVLYKVVPIMPFFNLRLAYNEGAAFGILSSENGWQRAFFIALTMGVSSVIIYWLHKLEDKNILESCALTLILGGALGNLFDRIWYGYVIDFIDFYIGIWHWYTFNVADIAICIGAALFAFVTLFRDNANN